MCKHLKLGVWGCVWETACTLPTCHTFSSEIVFHPPHQFRPQEHRQNRKNILLGSGNGAVAAKLCLERPFWPRLPKKGVTQWWGRPGFWVVIFIAISNIQSLRRGSPEMHFTIQ